MVSESGRRKPVEFPERLQTFLRQGRKAIDFALPNLTCVSLGRTDETEGDCLMYIAAYTYIHNS